MSDDTARQLLVSCGEANGGAMFGEQLVSQTVSRWLARAVGKRREAKPTLRGGAVFNMSENSYQNQSSENGVHKVMVPWKLLVLIVILSVSTAALVSALIIQGWPRVGVDIREQEKFNISGTIINKNEALAKLSAQVIKRRLNSMLITGNAYSKNKRLIRFINEDKWVEAINSIAGLLKEDLNGSAERIFLTDVAGTLRADFPKVPEVSGQNFAFREWYKGVTRNFEPYLSEVYIRTAKPQFNVVAFAFAIKDRMGIPVAILAIETKSDAFLNWIYDINIGKDGRLFMVDQKGHVVAHPDFAPQGNIIDYSGEPDVQRVVSGLAGSDIFLSEKGLISSYEPVTGYGWAVVARVPIKEAKGGGGGGLMPVSRLIEWAR